ncbi:MAG: hypothetical protein CMI36_06635 [Owenweeksia sp.]|nr:hypothetical protein [Owenweeksia sp.]MBF98648.1 hypothetical protein [Owenweeksia sp.]HBF21922.1 hypothetical protein [Cryomorphaceae bacterium]HCQ15690.1 hypothetical protein [Cryomorphaceae bacterium]|tara:strand:+ start:377 stop:766 length:390 start_codon:yes stop_codon:yes gene_type:complete
MFRPIAILTSLLFLSFYAQALGIKPISLQGVVTDVQSGEVIPGAVISIERNGEVIHSVETDGQGGFTLNYDAPYLRTDEVRVSIFKKGYKVQKMKTLHQEKEELIIELEKRPKFVPLILPSTSKHPYDI